jgi:hypothetical protein
MASKSRCSSPTAGWTMCFTPVKCWRTLCVAQRLRNSGLRVVLGPLRWRGQAHLACYSVETRAETHQWTVSNLAREFGAGFSDTSPLHGMQQGETKGPEEPRVSSPLGDWPKNHPRRIS